MSYVFVASSNINTNTDVPYGISLSFADNGVFRSIGSNNTQALENFKNLLLTYPGERTGDWITFGCNLKSLLFSQNTDEIKSDIQDTIFDATSQWLPYINIITLDIVTAEDDPNLDHAINVRITFTVEAGFLEQTIQINATESGVITIE
jgi:phage baseplate assembly protein W